MAKLDNFIIAEDEKAFAAFRVDSASEVILPARVLSQGKVVLERLAGAVRGALPLGDKLVPVIDLMELLGEPERSLMNNCSEDRQL